MLTLRLGNPDQFAAVRDYLVRAGYTEQAVCRKLGVDGLHECFKQLLDCAARLQTAAPSTLKVLVQLLIAGKSLPRAEVARAIPRAALDAMNALGILSAHSGRSKHLVSAVALYPIGDLYVASERWNATSSPDEATDHVFSAVNPLTHEFLELLPQDPCNKFLDLCSGTAIAALLAAKLYARHSWAVDIASRATRFGEFNRRLNAVENATVIQGDLYKPVKGMKFDRIVAHTPYAPSLKRRPLYAHGGLDGELITRAIIQGLPRHLAPGGRFYCLAANVEREGEPYEQRVRQFLGARQSDFNIVYIEAKTQGPLQFAYRNTRHSKGTWDDMDKWVEHFEKLKIKNLVYGLLIVQSRNSKGASFTVRRKKAENGAIAEAEWLRTWESAWADPTRREQILALRPLASQGAELHVVHARQNSGLSPSKFTLTSNHPFTVKYECSAWVAALFERCDGKFTALEYFETGKREGWIPGDLSAPEFSTSLGELVARGLLEVEGFQPPRPKTLKPQSP